MGSTLEKGLGHSSLKKYIHPPARHNNQFNSKQKQDFFLGGLLDNADNLELEGREFDPVSSVLSIF